MSTWKTSLKQKTLGFPLRKLYYLLKQHQELHLAEVANISAILAKYESFRSEMRTTKAHKYPLL